MTTLHGKQNYNAFSFTTASGSSNEYYSTSTNEIKRLIKSVITKLVKIESLCARKATCVLSYRDVCNKKKRYMQRIKDWSIPNLANTCLRPPGRSGSGTHAEGSGLLPACAVIELPPASEQPASSSTFRSSLCEIF